MSIDVYENISTLYFLSRSCQCIIARTKLNKDCILCRQRHLKVKQWLLEIPSDPQKRPGFPKTLKTKLKTKTFSKCSRSPFYLFSQKIQCSDQHFCFFVYSNICLVFCFTTLNFIFFSNKFSEWNSQEGTLKPLHDPSYPIPRSFLENITVRKYNIFLLEEGRYL